MEDILIIIAFNLILYFPTLRYKVVIDDIHWYKEKEGGWGKEKNIFDFIAARLYGGGTFGNNTEIDHLFTIVLHTAICVLMYLAFGSNTISFWAAMLYACNPANHQTAIWLNGRRYAVNIIITLLILWLGLWAAPLYFLTYLFHMTAFFMPILLMGHSSFLILLVPFFLILSFPKIKKLYRQRLLKILNKKQQLDWYPQRITVTSKLYGFYFFKMILPQKIVWNYEMLSRWAVTEEGNKNVFSFNQDFGKGLLAVILSLSGCVVFKDQLFFYWVFLILSTLQWCAIIPVTQFPAERYISLPNIFMMFFVSYLLDAVGQPGLVLPLMVYYIVNLSITMPMYKDIFSLYKYQLYHEPRNITMRVFYINGVCMPKGDWIEAALIAREGLDYYPKDFCLLTVMAGCCKALGNRKAGIEFLNKAEQNYYVGQEAQQAEYIKHLKKVM